MKPGIFGWQNRHEGDQLMRFCHRWYPAKRALPAMLTMPWNWKLQWLVYSPKTNIISLNWPQDATQELNSPELLSVLIAGIKDIYNQENRNFAGEISSAFT